MILALKFLVVIYPLSDQSEESLTLVPVGATPQLELSESNNHRNQDTEESPRDEYEEIELSPPVMMVCLCFLIIIIAKISLISIN